MVSNFVILWYVCVCVFLILFLCFLCLFYFGWFVLLACSFSKEREKAGIELGEWGSRNDRGRNERGQIIIRIFCMKNNYFQLKNKFPML